MNCIKTKFARAKTSRRLATSTYSRPVPAIDKQVYAKYGLSAEEVKFIESNVREME